MKNITRFAGDNLGGLSVCFYTDWDNIDFTRFPKLDGLKLIGNIYLKPGTTWGHLVFTTHSTGFDQAAKSDRRGTVYSHQITGTIPKATPDLDLTLSEMNSQRRFAVLHRDRNGYLRLSGGPNYGLEFNSKFTTQEKPDGLNAHKVSFKAEALDPALYYSGTFEVTEIGEVNTPAPGGSGGFVTIVDGEGNILQVVPGGQTFEISSGFSFGFRIL